MKKFLDYNIEAVEEMKKNLEKALKMTTTQINREYLIKVHGLGYNMLVGVNGLLALVGDTRATKMIQRANACMSDVCKCRVYGQDLQVSFYIH